MLIPTGEYRPRLWVRLIVNPFFHRKGRGSIIRWRTRMDVFPFRDFQIGDDSVIEDFSTVNNAVGDVIIGKSSLIGVSNVIIGPVEIGDEVILAQNIVISGLNHGYEDVSKSPMRQKVTTAIIRIGDKVWIGANSTITAGVTLGTHCIIGAGSVVTKDIPPFSVAVGNPAKVIKTYNPQTKIWEKIK